MHDNSLTKMWTNARSRHIDAMRIRLTVSTRRVGTGASAGSATRDYWMERVKVNSRFVWKWNKYYCEYMCMAPMKANLVATAVSLLFLCSFGG